MANVQPILPRSRPSAAVGAMPATTQVSIGELATNTTDGSLFLCWAADGVTKVIRKMAATDSPVFTGTPTTTTPVVGDNTANIASTSFVYNAKLASVTVSTTGGSTTLTAVQYGYSTIILTGALTSAATIIMPNIGNWLVFNRTSGAYSTTIKTASGTGIVATQGFSNEIVADGTNIVVGGNDYLASGFLPVSSPQISGIATFSNGPIVSSLTANTLISTNSSNTLSSVALGSSLSLTSNTLVVQPSGIIVSPTSLTGAITLTQAQHTGTLVSGDTSSVAYTIPQLTAGTVIEVIQGAAGKVTFTAGSGVTLQCAVSGATGTRTTYSAMRFRWLSSTTVNIAGDVA